MYPRIFAMPAILLLTVFAAGHSYGEVKSATVSNPDAFIIANSSVAIDAMTKEDIGEIFLGKKVKWNEGGQIKIAMLKKSGIYEEFVNDFTRKTLHQFHIYWKRLVFIGKGLPPKLFETEEELVNYVARTEGAISYAESLIKADGVKIIVIK